MFHRPIRQRLDRQVYVIFPGTPAVRPELAKILKLLLLYPGGKE
jgi:hypothetical protein